MISTYLSVKDEIVRYVATQLVKMNREKYGIVVVIVIVSSGIVVCPRWERTTDGTDAADAYSSTNQSWWREVAHDSRSTHHKVVIRYGRHSQTRPDNRTFLP